MLKKCILFSIIFLLIINKNLNAQQKDTTITKDLFADIETESKALDVNQTNYALATFKSIRVVNSHTTEMVGKNNLDFRISHRFGYLSSGGYNLFGLDNATIRLGFDYGLSKNVNIGIGRSSVDKEFDVYAKFKLLRQSTGKTNMPISLNYVFTAMHYTLKTIEDISFTNRNSFAHQLIIARKFNDNVSFQLMPSLVHINLVPLKTDDNNLFSLGFAGRTKLSKRVALNAEYFHQFNNLSGAINSLSLGFDIETGGHVFQLHCTNSTGMTERTFITNTTGDWGAGDIRFGFNIVRTFALKKAAGSRSSW
ncbi:MAG: hypothetical protein KGZ59_12405 [Chitinophagaceae bacterium]|nr:hypothetical protein [Chitinophagaceae bacterium]